MTPTTFMASFFMVALLLGQNFDLVAASRPLLHTHPPAVHIGSLNKPIPPSIGRFTINRYKMTESSSGADAFRPTSPGHSPGVGHQNPPGALL
ncbi:hypothetical protein GBA52_016309 [Prunus armeniaca]|nr:hypothetical protein GBA52_016309 [Prunus armeniaca]